MAPNGFERALLDLTRKSVDAPKGLSPEDLEPLRQVVGEGAVDYTLVLGGFHFINRVADLLHVDPEVLPAGLRRFDLVRRLGVRAAARLFSKIDLANRGGMGRAERIREILRLSVEERDSRSSLSRDLVARVHRGVEAALPSRREEAEGFHARPRDPLDAFVFVGTRYAARTTEAMIRELRAGGFDDLAILDLVIAVADANQWARTHRLLRLDPGLFYVGTDAARSATGAYD